MAELDPEKQRRFAVEVVERLRAAGFIAYWAGGCVRDQILGLAPGDYDVATGAKPDEVRRVFGHRGTLAIGAAYGVIAVIGPHGAGQVEVTTFRNDADYRDGRHPSHVVFSSPEEDAQRRDFTINGMFYDPIQEQVIDFVGGQEDLRRRIVRAIGQPRARFAEDKLRMLRAARFAARFDFTLDSDTATAIRDMAAQLTVVSPERIAAEMEAMLLDRHRGRAVELLRETGLLVVVLPEVGREQGFGPELSRTGTGDREQGTEGAAGAVRGSLEQTVKILDALNEPTFAVGLAALLQAVDEAKIAERVGRRWRLAKKHFERAAWLLDHRAMLAAAGRLPWSQLQPILIHDGAGELLLLGDALAAVGLLDPAVLAFCRERLALPVEKLNPPPLLTGDDLIALAIPRGKQYSALLHEIRAAQLDGKIATREEAREIARGSAASG